MAYRTSARDEHDPVLEVKGDSLARVEVSGHAGLSGPNGRSGADGYGAGADGQAGSDAGRAEVGENAGIIHAILKSDPTDRENALLEGTGTSPNGHRRSLSRTVPLGDAGFIDLVARGGPGGRGGNGGNGGSGARGRAGADATRYSSGGDGGPGGDGGRGGNGTSGADGGAGGAIIAEVANEDTHLLMLLRYGVEGGPGGAPGINGAGGLGGSGGPGGSSYSWTESESYTDSQGHTQTRTTHHSNSGGSSGRPGNAGMPGTAYLTSGNAGPAGSFVIHVTNNGQTEAYPERYDLRLLGFEHRSDNDDGIYEPEEMIQITKVEVMNVGGMPTPATRKIELSLREQGWVYPEQQHLTMPFSLGPGQRHTFVTEKLSAKLGAFHPSKPSDPLAQEEVVRHRAFVPDARREFAHYENHRSFELGRFLIRFPIESSPIEALFSLGPGQASRLRFTIKNSSTKPYGARSELGRRLAFRLFFHESELGDDHILFFDDTGARIPLSRGFSREIPELLPGQSLTVEGILAVSEEAPFFRAGRMWLSLELGSIANPAEPKPIQYRAFDVRVSRPFDREALGDVLLVVNNRTDAGDVEAWQGLCSALGLRFSVYDLSLEGGFELGQNGKLSAEELRGRTIVFLNHFMDTTKGERKSIHYVAKEQLLELCAAGARVHIVGEPFALERFLVPTSSNSASTAPVTASSTYLVVDKDKPRATLSVGDEPIHLEIPKWSVFGMGKPSEEAIVKRANAIHDLLERRYPGRRHLLVWELAPELVKDYFVASRWKMGRISIHRSLDGVPAAISTATLKGPAENHRERILQRENMLQFLLALPFSEKLRRLEALTQSMAARNDDDDRLAGSVVGMVLHAIVIDLVEEQLELLRRPWCEGATTKSLRAKLGHLREVAEQLYATRSGSPEPEARAALLHILSCIRFFALSQVKMWEWVPPLVFERRAPVLRSLTLDLIDECITRILGGGNAKSPDAKARISIFEKELGAAYKSFVDRYKRAKKNREWFGGRGGYARELLLGPLANTHFRRNSHLMKDAASSMMSKQQYAEIVAKDQQATSRRKTMMKRAAGAKDALLVEMRSAELLAKARKE